MAIGSSDNRQLSLDKEWIYSFHLPYRHMFLLSFLTLLTYWHHLRHCPYGLPKGVPLPFGFQGGLQTYLSNGRWWEEVRRSEGERRRRCQFFLCLGTDGQWVDYCTKGHVFSLGVFLYIFSSNSLWIPTNLPSSSSPQLSNSNGWRPTNYQELIVPVGFPHFVNSSFVKLYSVTH